MAIPGVHICARGATDGIAGLRPGLLCDVRVVGLAWDLRDGVWLEGSVGGGAACGEGLGAEIRGEVVAYFYSWGVLEGVRIRVSCEK